MPSKPRARWCRRSRHEIVLVGLSAFTPHCGSSFLGAHGWERRENLVGL
jgi:hypothetical protein